MALGCESPVSRSNRLFVMRLVVSTMMEDNWVWMLCGSSSDFKVRKEIRIFFPSRQNFVLVFRSAPFSGYHR